DTTPPHVISVSPAPSAGGEPLGTVVPWIRSEPLTALSAPSAAGLSDGGAVEGTVEVGAGGVRLSFVPGVAGVAAALAPDTAYTATLGSLAQDLAGNALENGDFVSTFRTAPGADSAGPRIVSVSPFRRASDVHEHRARLRADRLDVHRRRARRGLPAGRRGGDCGRRRPRRQRHVDLAQRPPGEPHAVACRGRRPASGDRDESRPAAGHG